MTGLLPALIAANGLCVALLLVGESNGNMPLRAASKLTASTLFFVIAWAAGLADSPVQVPLVLAIAGSWLGDAFLLGRSRTLFLAGLGAILAGHVAYAIAFFGLGPAPGVAWGALGASLLAGGAVVGAMLRFIPGPLRAPVVAYVVAIACMVATASGAAAAHGAPLLAVGAVAFLASDIAVALERFVKPGFLHRAWGLPLYYGGQVAILLGASALR